MRLASMRASRIRARRSLSCLRNAHVQHNKKRVGALTPVYGFVLVGILLLALYAAHRAAKHHRDRGTRPRRTGIKPASVRMSMRTEMRAMDDAFSVMGPTTRPEVPTRKTREAPAERAHAASATRDR
jgi:hypothetical protein